MTHITMTKAEAEQLMKVLDFARTNAVRVIGEIKRSRSLVDADKATMSAPHMERLDVCKTMQERIGTAFNLGGY